MQQINKSSHYHWQSLDENSEITSYKLWFQVNIVDNIQYYEKKMTTLPKPIKKIDYELYTSWRKQELNNMDLFKARIQIHFTLLKSYFNRVVDGYANTIKVFEKNVRIPRSIKRGNG